MSESSSHPAEATAADAKPNAAAVGLLNARGGRRTFVPISRAFLQQRQRGGGPGPLASFVSLHRGRALELWLLAHAIASTPPWDVTLTARTWARALGLPETPTSRVSISTSWSWLEKQQLIRSERHGALRRVYLLADAGDGNPYQHSRDDGPMDYFKLPHTYWLSGWNSRLDLPSTAVLLIALSLPTPFRLPQEHGADWYGLSRDTIRRGLHTLIEHELLTFTTTYKPSRGSPTGASEQRHYFLQPPFRTPRRQPAPETDSKTGSAAKMQQKKK